MVQGHVRGMDNWDIQKEFPPQSTTRNDSSIGRRAGYLNAQTMSRHYMAEVSELMLVIIRFHTTLHSISS